MFPRRGFYSRPSALASGVVARSTIGCRKPMDAADRSSCADLTQARLSVRWPLLCFAATFVLYVALIPRILLYSSPPTGDQAYYLIETISLVQDGDFNVANNYAQHDEDKFYALAPHPPGFVGIAAPYPLPPQLSHATNR